MELCASSEIGKWSINGAESSKRKETEEKESQSSTRVKKIFLGPNKIPFSAIFDAKNNVNVITQITAEENITILHSSKESILRLHDRKSQGKEAEDKLEVDDSEKIIKIKDELKKMGRNLDMVIEDPEKWLALEVSGMNKEDKVESPQKKFKMDLKPPEANYSAIAADYFNLFQEETRYISDTNKHLLSEEPKDNIINPLEKRKFEELENESAVITEDKMDQVWDTDIKKGIK
ncbi:hypothetical protein O181_030186 [Austropuccinia psidii MF-1]|uniref:Uncharacterized protein n=1 Tax=Austropuccinia psidii MF-1 TaxID=1389203 RepID=A0A9Q3CSH2_9BASI|nr:hypothetical protein [Austropuccinia psidii MF-1]